MPPMSDADWVLAALEGARPGTSLTIADMAEWIDWQNHVRYRDDEIEKALAELINAKKVRRVGKTKYGLAKSARVPS
jgi:hypothetical protein